MTKIKLGLIFGGRSGEHEVSLISARSIFDAIDKNKYNVSLIGIDKKGSWHLGEANNFWINPEDQKKVKLNLKNAPEITAVNKNEKVYLIDLKNGKNLSQIDVFFPITHGTFGEDGCLQGFLELLGAAYVGPGVLGSAVGMDKDFMKRIFREKGIATADYFALTKGETDKKKISKIIKTLGFPIFVKPANLGSSVGISKAKNGKGLKMAIDLAFQYDTKIILEEAIVGREIECSVLGNEKPIASQPGEIKLSSEFYSYAAKYIDGNASQPIPKAELPKKEMEQIQNLAIAVFKALGCEGMGRVDFFLTKNGKIYANEINTLPGFTAISMYPKMFAESGISYPKLLDKLVQLGLERKERNDKLKRDFAI